MCDVVCLRVGVTVFVGQGGGHHGSPIGPFHPPHVARHYRIAGTVMQSVMWFWVFYRAKQDGAALVVG